MINEREEINQTQMEPEEECDHPEPEFDFCDNGEHYWYCPDCGVEWEDDCDCPEEDEDEEETT